MTPELRFETPENIEVAYHPAGQGTRFIAWFIDNIFVILFTIGLIFGVAALIALIGLTVDEVLPNMNPKTPAQGQQAVLYVFGMLTVVWNFGSFIYFSLSEYFFRGQTLGKKATNISVVKIDGFALDASSVMVRNIFRFIDHIPLFWIVPIVSAKHQRFGDMVAGTLVVRTDPVELSGVRSQLAERPAAEAKYRFEPSALRRLRPTDVKAIERILERWGLLDNPQREALLNQLVPPLVARLQTAEPPLEERVAFLEDLLAAEYRRQHRRLA